jgi:hypothetical protein
MHARHFLNALNRSYLAFTLVVVGSFALACSRSPSSDDSAAAGGSDLSANNAQPSSDGNGNATPGFAGPTCAHFNAPADKLTPELKTAMTLMTKYYDTWNTAASELQQKKPSDPGPVLAPVFALYADGATVTQVDNGITANIANALEGGGPFGKATSPSVALPATAFASFFLSKQPGSHHAPDYLCVSGSQITIGLWYYAPFPGQSLDPAHLPSPQVAASVHLVANYVMDADKVKQLVFSYDFKWFNEQSTANGIPVTP